MTGVESMILVMVLYQWVACLRIFSVDRIAQRRKIIAKKSGEVVDGLIFSKCAAFGWMG